MSFKQIQLALNVQSFFSETLPFFFPFFFSSFFYCYYYKMSGGGVAALQKDRNFIAVIGDEVSVLV